MTSQAHGVLGLADSKYDSQYIRYIHELVYRIVPFLEELISCPLVDLPSDQNDRTCPEASGLGLPVKAIEPADAMGHFGFPGMVLQMDNPTRWRKTTEWTGWEPREMGLIEDTKTGGYF